MPNTETSAPSEVWAIVDCNGDVDECRSVLNEAEQLVEKQSRDEYSRQFAPYCIERYVRADAIAAAKADQRAADVQILRDEARDAGKNGHTFTAGVARALADRIEKA